MAPTMRSMSARNSEAAALKVAGSRVSKVIRSKEFRSKATRSKAAHSKTVAPLSFLDLPGEIRNMIYGYFMSSVSITAKQHTPLPSHLDIAQTLDSFWPSTGPEIGHSQISIIRKSLPIALIFTCRTLYTQVAPLLAPLLAEVATEPLRIIASGHEAGLALTCAPSPLIACLGAQVNESSFSDPVRNKAAEDFVAPCHHPPSSYNTGDVDIEISIVPKHIPQRTDMLERVFEGIQARASEGTLRFRVVIHRMGQWGLTEPMPKASLDMGHCVEVREVDFVQWCDHVNDLRRMWKH